MGRKVIVFFIVATIIAGTFCFGEGVYASQNLVRADMVTDDDSVFVDGINQSYLDYRQITREEFLKEIANASYDDDEDMMLKSGSQSSGLGFFDFEDIIKNPKKYFDVSIDMALPISNVKVGINFEKINETLKYITYPVKDSKDIKIHIENVKINKVANNSLYFGAEARVRLYAKIPIIGRIKTLDRTAKASFRLDYYFDSKDNSLNFKRINMSDFSIERKIHDYILRPLDIELISQGIESIIRRREDLDKKVKLDFLDPRYFKTPYLYTEGYFLYINFNINSENVINDLLKLLKNIGINVQMNYSLKDEIPVMKSNTSPTGIASASSIYSSAYQAWRAFDGNDVSGDCSRWISKPGQLPAWLAYEFPSAKKITKYFILPELSPNTRNRAPKNWTFEGWNGSSWVVLDTRSNITLQNSWIPNIEGMYFDVKSPGYYKKYRIRVTALNGSDAVSIRQFKMFEKENITITNTSSSSNSNSTVILDRNVRDSSSPSTIREYTRLMDNDVGYERIQPLR